MILFNDKYKLKLYISHGDFINGLQKKTVIREDLTNDIFPNKKKEFLGQIDYNRFSIVINKSSIFQNNYKITGHIIGKGDNIQIEGSIKGYKFLLLFVLTYCLFSFGGMIGYLFFLSGHQDLRVFFLILTLIGITNFYSVISGLNKYKRRFIENIKNIN